MKENGSVKGNSCYKVNDLRKSNNARLFWDGKHPFSSLSLLPVECKVKIL